jgi:magnesium transporter
MVRKFVRRSARANLSKLLARARPQDVAAVFGSLTPAERLEVFQVLRVDYPDACGDVLTELDPAERLALLEQLSPADIAGVLERMPVDDAVFLVDTLPPELQESVLALVDLGRRTEVQAQLTYEDYSAGRIMDSVYFALPVDTTVRSAVAAIQEMADVEMIFYLYVVDAEGRLAGVTSLRQLLLSPVGRTLGEIMNRAVIRVTPDTEQEEVAQLASRYDLLAVPVVDADNRMLGIVTVDDILDVVKEEANEDVMKMVGSSDDELLYQDRPLAVARIRLPWLLFNVVALLASGILLYRFQGSLGQALVLLTFVPLVMGLGSNLAGQTSTLAVRGLAAGRIVPGEGGRRQFLWQQAKLGLLLGIACGLVVAVGAALLEGDATYGVVVGGSIFAAMIVGALSGAAIPLVFARFGLDPANAAGPLVTTTNEILALTIYFGLASLLIEQLLG